MVSLGNYRELNQACEEHFLSFAPLNQKISSDPVHDPSKQGIDYLYYIPEEKGVRILENGDVEFCFYAPQAQTVEVAGIGGAMGTERHALHKGQDGYWRAVVPGIPPGFHLHKYYVDGVQLLNKLAPIGYGTFAPNNIFEKPDEHSDFYYIKDVPHGDVRMELYRSSVNGRLKCCYVYTPPGYDASDKRYPVVYLQHGATENEIGWVWHAKVNFILDNLLAEGNCKEMLVVMNCGYGFVGEESPVFLPGDLDRELAEDCVPFIDAKYRTLANRDGRAVAGLSLGSAQAFYAALKHRDLYASLGMFSGGLPLVRADYDYSAFFEDADRVNSNFRLLYLGMGEQESWCENTRQVCRELDQKGIRYKFFSCPGFHEWDVWKRCFHDFAQVVFKEGK